MVKITKSEGKITPSKKIITLKNIQVGYLRFVDETGDITEQVIEALPAGVTDVSFKITVELPEEATDTESR